MPFLETEMLDHRVARLHDDVSKGYALSRAEQETLLAILRIEAERMTDGQANPCATRHWLGLLDNAGLALPEAVLEYEMDAETEGA